MGTASVEMTIALRERLISTPALAVVRSPLLPAGDNGCQEIIIDGDRVRFKKWEDT